MQKILPDLPEGPSYREERVAPEVRGDPLIARGKPRQLGGKVDSQRAALYLGDLGVQAFAQA